VLYSFEMHNVKCNAVSSASAVSDSACAMLCSCSQCNLLRMLIVSISLVVMSHNRVQSDRSRQPASEVAVSC
jgi:hypothetical protein